jgi:hypothetical protein
MEAVSGDFFPHVVGAYADAAEDIHLQLIGLYSGPAEDVPYVNQEYALEYLRDTSNRMVQVTEGTWARARGQLIEGFAAGESIEELSARLQNVTDWGGRRAATVARTEIISASNAGALAEVRTLNPDASKEWMATKDDRTREWHREADGETVLLDQTFTVGGEELDYPGDPTASPANRINCRCTQGFHIPREAVRAAVDDFSELRDVTDEFDPADFQDFGSLTAALTRYEFARKPFDELKHRRGHGGKFAPKSGGGATREHRYKVPSPEPAEPMNTEELSDTMGPTPNTPVVPVTDDVIGGLDLISADIAGPDDRVFSQGRLGTVRDARQNEYGLNDELSIQFDDNPTAVESVSADDVQLIDDADVDEVLDRPFDANVIGNTLANAGIADGSPAPEVSDPEDDERIPFQVSQGFDPITFVEAQSMQDEMTLGSPWSVRQEDALIAYSGGAYQSMNDCLRTGSGCSPDVELDNRRVSEAMRPTTRPTTVFRTANFAALGVFDHQELQGLTGTVVSDAGFTSTSVSPAVFDQRNGGVLLQIEVPAGVRAAYIDEISEHGAHSDAALEEPERELLLDRGTRFEVIEVGTSGGRSTVRVRVLS